MTSPPQSPILVEYLTLQSLDLAVTFQQHPETNALVTCPHARGQACKRRRPLNDRRQVIRRQMGAGQSLDGGNLGVDPISPGRSDGGHASKNYKNT